MAKAKKSEAEESKDLVQAGSGALTVGINDIDIGSDSGAGADTMTADDLVIPRIGIVQSLSPQRQKTKPEFIEGAEEGMFYENVSKRLFKGEEGIIVVPIQFDKIYLEWYDRKSGKGQGLFKNHGKERLVYDQTAPDDTGRRWTNKDEGRFIAPTAQYFVFLLDPNTGSFTPSLMGFSSVFLKHAKRWNSNIKLLRVTDPKTGNMVEPPIFYNSWKITTVPETNQQGSWFRQEIVSHEPLIVYDADAKTYKDGLPNGIQIYMAAKKFREDVIAGKVKVSDPVDEAPASGGSEDDTDPM